MALPLIQVETEFGTVSAVDQALIEALTALLVTAGPRRATEEDLIEAVRWECAWQDSNLRPTA